MFSIDFKNLTYFLLTSTKIFDLYLHYRQYMNCKKEKIPQKIKDIKGLEVNEKEFLEAKRYTADKECLSIVELVVCFVMRILQVKFDYFSWLWLSL